MLDMSQIETIRHLREQGDTQSQIASKLGISRPTVSKYLKIDDFSPKPPAIPASRESILGPFKPTIDEILESDKRQWRKQRHTARRIFDRLVDEYGFEGGYSTVQRYVRKTKETKEDGQYLDLLWHPGTIQVDFGEADFFERGMKVRRYFLVASFPHSNMAFCQLFAGTTAECVCQGLADIFDHVGGVPQRAVFDNATGIGRKVCGKVREAKLFRSFRLHHGFEASFCNPNSGHEKGNVENKVGFIRNNLFVPVPAYDDIEGFNADLLARCSEGASTVHYRKQRTWGDLFEVDVQACRALPDKHFDAVRYEIYRAGKTGMVSVDGCHDYSTSPSCCGKDVIVGLRAHKVTIADRSGEIVATHVRRFGSRHTEDIDPMASLRLLGSRPGAWGNSRIREAIPEELAAYLDIQPREALSEYLDMLDSASRVADYDAAIDAMCQLSARSTDFTRNDLEMLARRIATYGKQGVPEPGPDLSYYDDQLLKRGA